MKRRNVDLSKIRRPLKIKKPTESVFSGNLFSYLKFLAIWGLVLLADFLLEFRFEYLYPVWLLIRSVQDSYRYQGILLTMMFVTLASGADLLCYIFMPVQWLFFAASSYVWVQYVWHTDRGINPMSISLWLLFIYVEAALRMREQKSLPFNMDLCRPFAAHCIGYPVVTLGYGLKTAAAETIRKRTRSKVQKRNRFYIQLLQEALPPELQIMEADEAECKEDSSDMETLQTAEIENDNRSPTKANQQTEPSSTPHKPTPNKEPNKDPVKAHILDQELTPDESVSRDIKRRNINIAADVNEDNDNDQRSKVAKDPVPKRLNGKKSKNTSSSTTNSTSNLSETGKQKDSNNQSNGTAIHAIPNGHKRNNIIANGDTATSSPNNRTVDQATYSRLETDIKKLKTELTASKNAENELRTQLSSRTSEERHKTVELSQLQQDNDTLQNKLHNLVSSRQQDKVNVAALEKQLQEEKKLREKVESQLVTEKKIKKQEEQVAARAVAIANASLSTKTGECAGQCRSKQKELEDEVTLLRRDIKRKDDLITQLERDVKSLKEHKDANNENRSALLMSALSAMQEKTSQLENQLNNETKIKMDMFKALNEFRHKSDMQNQLLISRDAEINKLRSHITEALALVPSSMYADQPFGAAGSYTTPRLDSPTMPTQTLNGNGWLPHIAPHDMMYPVPPHHNHSMAMVPRQQNTSPHRYSPQTSQSSQQGPNMSPNRNSESEQ